MNLFGLAKLSLGSVEGDASVEIKSVAPIGEAQSGDLVFVLEDKFLEAAQKSNASAVVARIKTNKPTILVKNPRLAMAKILKHFSSRSAPKPGIHPAAVIEKNARLGKDVSIGPFVYVGEKVEIGDNSVIYPHVTIYGHVIIGRNVIIHSGVSIGLDGFGFVPAKEGALKIPQIGKVVIEDDVEIYSNSCVARGTMGETRIGKGSKIDTLVHIAHNCKIGRHCLFASQTGLAGSVTIGNNVLMGGKAGVRDHVTIGDDCVVLARSGVTKDIPAGSIVSGYPAQDHKKEMREQARLRKLLSKK